MKSYEELQTNLNKLRTSPPWLASLQDSDLALGPIVDGVGAPEPGEYATWQKAIQALEAEIGALQEINRP